MTLMDLTYQLFGVTLDLDMTIQARQIPGYLNHTADLLFRRHQVVNTEWTLKWQMASQPWSMWGCLMIDLMVTELTTQLPTYISLYPDPQAPTVNAMSCNWKGMDAYLFPPWAMLGEVLAKLA